eukprot:1640349-Rhodomonas_salina.2
MLLSNCLLCPSRCHLLALSSPMLFCLKQRNSESAHYNTTPQSPDKNDVSRHGFDQPLAALHEQRRLRACCPRACYQVGEERGRVGGETRHARDQGETRAMLRKLSTLEDKNEIQAEISSRTPSQALYTHIDCCCVARSAYLPC